ncbi:MFS transporter [Kineococcus glutinatus]
MTEDQARAGRATGAGEPFTGHARGGRGYRRTVVALFAAGVATFAQLYSVQAVLPALAGGLRVDPARAALGVSVATGALALSVLGWSALADRFGRVRVMAASVLLASALGLAVPAAGGLGLLLPLRALQGAALGGLPAVAVAYVAEEVRAADVTRAAAAYVSGTTIGGLLGRLVSSAVADVAGWRAGVLAVGVLGVLASVVFLLVVPPSRGFRRAPRAGRSGPRLRAALADPGLLALYAQGLLLMGAFSTVYNVLGFRLLAEPFGVSQTVVGLLFTGYLAGTVSSAVAGRAAERWGRLPVLLTATAAMAAGVLVTASASLPAVVAGLLLFTAGFFAAHAIASGWTGGRARTGRAQASALYTLAYYAGSSGLGWAGSAVFTAAGWPAVAGFVVLLCALALGCALVLLRSASGRGAGAGWPRSRPRTAAVTSAGCSRPSGEPTRW